MTKPSHLSSRRKLRFPAILQSRAFRWRAEGGPIRRANWVVGFVMLELFSYCLQICVNTDEKHILFIHVICKTIHQHNASVYMGLDARKPVFGVCEQQRRRRACASLQTNQRICYSLFGKCHI